MWLAASLAYGLAFPKAGIAFLAFVFLIPLLLASENQTKGSAFRIFFSFAFIANILVLYWIPRVMVRYGGSSWTLAVVGLIVLAAYLAVYTGLAGMLINGWNRGRLSWAAAVWIPAVWIVKDLAVEKIISGFPWCSAGYSQYRNIYFVQLAEWGGIHLISFLVIAINVLLFRLVRARSRKAALAPLAVFLLVYAGGYALHEKHAARTVDQPFHRAGIIQPNSDHDQVYDFGGIKKTLDRLFADSAALKEQGAELVIWPEFTVPIYPLQSAAYKKKLSDFSKRHVPILAGFTDFPDLDQAYNSVMLFHGDEIEKYDKFHLTPFGEYVLFRRWLFFVKKITDQIGDFTPGKSLHTLNFAGRRLATPICYEVIYPELTRKMIALGGEVIVTISNDSWFGRTAAPEQHLAMAVFRGIENRRYLLRSTSNGISALADPTGRILYQSPLQQADKFLASFQYLNRQTVFTRWGYLFPYLCLILVSLKGLWTIFPKTKKPLHQP
ncbi:MAG TPA: apolipoprotein N-acyltransferase [Candidatus Binatia bacterium]|nr:apolipoprotein N-acyltransferase [Candidatus Binatia bacterium]